MKKVVVAIDSFKGSISSIQAVQSAADAIRHVFPCAHVVPIPVADGGEGTLEAIAYSLDHQVEYCQVLDPLYREHTAYFLTIQEGETAIIEMAKASGLPLLAIEDRNPLLTTSYGTGQMILAAIERGVKNIILTLGGSATNDAGIGLLGALGAKFYDRDHALLSINGAQQLSKIEAIHIQPVKQLLKEVSLTVICDVENPFVGERGATHFYAPQKGATPEMLDELEAGMLHLANLFEKQFDRRVHDKIAAGAAGGISGTLWALLDIPIASGVETILEVVGVEKYLHQADLVITGEGLIDRQTLMGKLPLGIARLAKKWQIPVLVVAGAVDWHPSLEKAPFNGIFSIQSGPISLKEAMREDVAIHNLKKTVEQICKVLHI